MRQSPSLISAEEVLKTSARSSEPLQELATEREPLEVISELTARLDEKVALPATDMDEAHIRLFPMESDSYRASGWNDDIVVPISNRPLTLSEWSTTHDPDTRTSPPLFADPLAFIEPKTSSELPIRALEPVMSSSPTLKDPAKV
jgi:hypothetical protein